MKKWNNAHDWLTDYITSCKTLTTARLVAHKLGRELSEETINAAFQEDMKRDGYFEQEED